MNIAKKLASWQAAKLLTPKQVENILAYETNTRRPIMTYSLVFLGMFCAVLGLISIIASNWHYIPAGLKLGADALLMLGLIYGILISNHENKTILKEGLILGYALLALATIGLVAQIYHLQPTGMAAIFFWSVITLPLLFYTKKSILPVLWFPAFFISGIERLNHFVFFQNLFKYLLENYYLILSPLLILFIATLYRLASSFYASKLAYIKDALFFHLLIIIAIVVIWFDCTGYSYQMFGETAPHTNGGLYLLVLSGIYYFFNRQKPQVYLSYVILIIAIAFFLAPFTFPTDISGYYFRRILTSKILGAGLSLGVLAIGGIGAYNTNRPKLLTLCSFLIALRLFIVYVQVFGSLLAQGIGLLVTGAVFLGIAYVWNKTRKELIIKLKGAK